MMRAAPSSAARTPTPGAGVVRCPCRLVSCASASMTPSWDVLSIILAQREIVFQGRRSVAARQVLDGRIGQPSIDAMAATIVTSAITADTAHTAVET